MGRYAIKWTNKFGKKVFYPEKTWSKKLPAEKFAIRLAYNRLQNSGTVMKDISVERID